MRKTKYYTVESKKIDSTGRSIEVSLWKYVSLGFTEVLDLVCGLLWIIHPVLPKGAEVSKRTLLWTRIAGVILILIGIFTRAHI